MLLSAWWLHVVCCCVVSPTAFLLTSLSKWQGPGGPRHHPLPHRPPSPPQPWRLPSHRPLPGPHHPPLLSPLFLQPQNHPPHLIVLRKNTANPKSHLNLITLTLMTTLGPLLETSGCKVMVRVQGHCRKVKVKSSASQDKSLMGQYSEEMVHRYYDLNIIVHDFESHIVIVTILGPFHSLSVHKYTQTRNHIWFYSNNEYMVYIDLH